MAERRMFAKTIVDSDAFLDMPTTAQLLYFHLSMRADDDGFVNSPKKIQRVVGCSDDDMRILLTRSFVIPFETGVCVITHWKIHNYIQNDRYKETIYKEEKALLTTDENKIYKLSENACIQTGYNMDTQDRLGKDRLELGKNISCPSNDDVQATRSHKIDYQTIANLYNEICKSLPKVQKLTDTRRKAIKGVYSLIEESGGFSAFFERVQASDFLCGRSQNGWNGCGFDWILKKANAVKIIEGNYDKRPSGTSHPDYTDSSRYENLSMEI